MGECCLEVYRRLLSDTELEVGSKGARSLREGDRGGHVPSIGRRAIEKEEKDGEGHVLVIRERNTIQVSQYWRAETRISSQLLDTNVSVQFIQVTLEHSG